jgi:hypothetical protein
MTATYKQLTDFLLQLGTDQVGHSEKSYLAHLIGVYRDMQAQGCTEEVCRAGMFHSIYGTELFQKFALPTERRADIRNLIGERAERLAYINCMMDRASFDRMLEQAIGPYRITLRPKKEEVELPEDEFADLCRVHLYDWLEQVARSKRWDYRREAYQKMAARLGPAALKAYEKTYAEAAAT